MGYINPYVRDDGYFLAREGRQERKQAREDFLAAKTGGGIDAAIFDKFDKFRVPKGFKKIPGASRSGALDPSTRTRFLQREQDGEIELARDGCGKLLGFRETNTYD